MLRAYTGENHLLGTALTRAVGASLAQGDADLYIVVPRQLTLLTERMLLGGLKLRGSFRLRVLSPARLCSLIFDAAGKPKGVRVDERGRVMLVRRAIRSAEGLTIYKNAYKRRGFAERCARQLELFIQGGVSAQSLMECAQKSMGATRMKFEDLAIILKSYLELMDGHFQDGEVELIEAATRAQGAAFIRSAEFFFYGFDLMPPTLMRLIAELSALCPSTKLFYPLSNDASARDADCYTPLSHAFGRIYACCKDRGAGFERVALPDTSSTSAIRALAQELYAYPIKAYAGDARALALSLAQDVREECMLAAAQARSLAMQGMRYAQMQLLCQDLASYRQPLIEAFRLYKVPLFLDNSRSVSRMATAECLLTALRLIEKNFRSEDVFTLMRCGYMPLSRDEGDRLANFAIRKGIEGGLWLRPLRRGSESEIEELEPLREKLIAPISELREALRAATSLKGQLTALFAFLEKLGAYEQSAELQRQLNAHGKREAAGALCQTWNLIVGALDQMAALMGEDKLSLRELTQALTEALDAEVVKPLPQSGDAVYAQGLGRMLMQPARALFILGLNDRSASGQDNLLTHAQRDVLSEHSGAYLGPNDSDISRLNRMYLKVALGMVQADDINQADDDAPTIHGYAKHARVFFSCALSGIDGSAQRPGPILEQLRRIVPALKETLPEQREKLMCNAPDPALSRVARAISYRREGKPPLETDLAAERALGGIAERMPDVRERLQRISSLLGNDPERDRLKPSAARALYGALQTQSVTRLERFAACPFAYFTSYGLRPDLIEPFKFDARQTGSFLHEAVNEFLRRCGRELNEMSAEEAKDRMALVLGTLLDKLRTGTPMEDSATERAALRSLEATATRCAQELARHMRGSLFHTDELERSFGMEDGAHSLSIGETILEGRVDRTDRWDEGNSLRVIDFKLGGKPLNLAGAYYGIQLQLPLYLGAALKRGKARSAGVYYFALDEGIVNTQATNPIEVEKERSEKFRLRGLLPEDKDLIFAQSQTPSEVFHGRMTPDGKLYANVPRADDVNFDRLIRHTMRMAKKQLDGIRAGEAAVSPASFDNRTPCGYCKLSAACLFDNKVDAPAVRRYQNIAWDKVFEKIALEDEQ